MKNALLCIGFGLIVGIGSCSAIRMTKSNIQVQKLDTSKIYNHWPPPIPAMIIQQNTIRATKPNLRPFKDSVINGLMSIKKVVDDNNMKLDSGLKRQTNYIQSQHGMIETLFEMQSIIRNLQLDTARLYKKSEISNDVKNDAEFGNTLKTLGIYTLVTLVVGVFAILITIGFVHKSLSDKLKNYA